jgi:hypothetical protein
MFSPDRTIKCLLAAIAVLLLILAGKPLLRVTPSAMAQTAADSALVVGYRTSLISSIKIASADRVRGVQVIDSAQSFVVQYDDRFEVYRVNSVTADQINALKSN